MSGPLPNQAERLHAAIDDAVFAIPLPVEALVKTANRRGSCASHLFPRASVGGAMTRSIAVLTFAAALLACHTTADDAAPDGDRQAQNGQPTAVQAKRITVDAHDLDRAQIRELAEHIEGIGDVASAKVKVHKDHEGNTQMLVEIAGADLPTDDYLTREIHSFDGLAHAAVLVEAVDPDEVGRGPMLDDENKTPEQIKAEVEERLRKQGVEGEVFVDVLDEDGERRVEVRVEADEPASGAPDLIAD
jgi:hypothetical protein